MKGGHEQVKFDDFDSEATPIGSSFVVKSIHRMATMLTRSTVAELAGTGRFNLPEWRVVVWLNALGTSSQRRLVDLTGGEQAQISRVLSDLERRGLVQSGQSAQDKRARVFSLTAQGADSFADVCPDVSQLYGRIDSVLSEAELAQFISMLNRLADALPGEESGTRPTR